MSSMTILDAPWCAAGPPTSQDDKCSVCHENPVYIGTMCRACFEAAGKPRQRGHKMTTARRERMRYSDEQVSQVVHAACIAMQVIWGDDMPSLPWTCEPRSVRRIVTAGVQRVRLAGLTARQNHENWVADKTAEGWHLGPEKDPEKLTHPDLVPWDELPQASRDKGDLFAAIVTVLASRE
jgi:hypothetical protein